MLWWLINGAHSIFTLLHIQTITEGGGGYLFFLMGAGAFITLE
jgi:hypothetical protein